MDVRSYNKPEPQYEAQATRTRVAGLAKTIRKIFSTLDGDFTVDDVAEQLNVIRPDMKLDRHAVIKALWRLVQVKELKIVVLGKGTRAGVYRVIKRIE